MHRLWSRIEAGAAEQVSLRRVPLSAPPPLRCPFRPHHIVQKLRRHHHFPVLQASACALCCATTSRTDPHRSLLLPSLPSSPPQGYPSRCLFLRTTDSRIYDGGGAEEHLLHHEQVPSAFLVDTQRHQCSFSMKLWPQMLTYSLLGPGQGIDVEASIPIIHVQ